MTEQSLVTTTVAIGWMLSRVSVVEPLCARSKTPVFWLATHSF